MNQGGQPGVDVEANNLELFADKQYVEIIALEEDDSGLHVEG